MAPTDQQVLTSVGTFIITFSIMLLNSTDFKRIFDFVVLKKK